MKHLSVLARALDRAARRFGAKIIDQRPFVLSNDPREREQNNIALMTALGPDYDAVVVLDSDGEFGRYVPYAVNRARPVVGTTGLVPAVWHWSFERHGAPQVNGRFERAAGRRMTGQDWAAWVAVKAIVQSVLRTRSTEFKIVSDYLRSDRLRVDGAKGPALNFRPWNNQLRQPIFLATSNAVIERSPMRGFLHPENDLDTLGEEAAGTDCRF